jgi:hypothetical protein
MLDYNNSITIHSFTSHIGQLAFYFIMMTELSDDNNDGDTDPNLVMVHNPDHFPHTIFKGAAAQLFPLRQENFEMESVFFQERYGCSYTNEYQEGEDTNNDDNGVLLLDSCVPVSIQTGASGEGDECNSCVSGRVFVTRSQVLFVANDPNESDQDMAIGGSCVLLHAMMDDPQMAIYLQLNGDTADHNDVEHDGGPMEITIVPSTPNDCQRLFDSLCQLVALHPTLEDDYDDPSSFESGAGFGMGNDLIWAPSSATMGIVEDDRVGIATEDERNAMLERLDNMLVVRPDLEIQEGQFEDAGNND